MALKCSEEILQSSEKAKKVLAALPSLLPLPTSKSKFGLDFFQLELGTLN